MIESTINGTGKWYWVSELASLLNQHRGQVVRINNEEFRYTNISVIGVPNDKYLYYYTLHFEKDAR